MYVYLNALKLQGSGALDLCIRTIHRWLTDQLGRAVSLPEITRAGQWRGLSEGRLVSIKSCAATDDDSIMYAWILSRTDNEVDGRSWTTTVGLRYDGEQVDFSCIIKVEHLNVLVGHEISVDQPPLIDELVTEVSKDKAVDFCPETIGLNLKKVGDDFSHYRELRAEIDNEDRDYPMVILSPHPKRGYLVDPDSLQDSLFGLAQVVEVAELFNVWEANFAEELGLFAWDGTIGIIGVPRNGRFSRSNNYHDSEMLKWFDAPARLSWVVAQITRISNINNIGKCTRFETVERIGREQEFVRQRDSLRAQAASEKEMVEFFGAEVERLKNDNHRLVDDKRNLESKLYAEQCRVAGLERRLLLAESVGAEKVFEAFIGINGLKGLSPEGCLNVIAAIYPARVVVLPSAIVSAREASSFEHGRKLLELFKILATDFYVAIQTSGDAKARNCFSNSQYAATESETTLQNPEAIKSRTFYFGDRELVMWRHLKIGVSNDLSHSIRVYFCWVAEEKKIVIGHCGKHLPISDY